MRNNIKENILELIQTLYEAHSNVETLIKEKDNQSVCALLEDCQNAAIHIGESIEQSEGENFITVKYLEAYCELLYTTSVNISNGIYEKINNITTEGRSIKYKSMFVTINFIFLE